MGRKKTHEEYLNDLASRGITHTPLEPYQSAKTKIIHKCIYGHEWAVLPTNILSGKGCPGCDKIDTEKYRLKLYEVNHDIAVLGEYIKSSTPILHKHIPCGTEWMVRPHDIIINLTGCPHCNKGVRKTHETYINELLLTEFELLEPYITGRVKLLHKHKICGYEWKVTPQGILTGSGCPRCSNSGLDSKLPCKLYLVQFYVEGESYYKIGITQKDIPARFQGDWNRFNMEIVWYREFSDYHRAKEAEALILREYCEYKINTGLLRSGNTETFSSDCLMLKSLY